MNHSVYALTTRGQHQVRIVREEMLSKLAALGHAVKIIDSDKDSVLIESRDVTYEIYHSNNEVIVKIGIKVDQIYRTIMRIELYEHSIGQCLDGILKMFQGGKK